MPFKDKTFCDSPGCKNKCKRKMTDKEKIELLAWSEGMDNPWVSYGQFCDEKGEEIKYAD